MQALEPPSTLLWSLLQQVGIGLAKSIFLTFRLRDRCGCNMLIYNTVYGCHRPLISGRLLFQIVFTTVLVALAPVFELVWDRVSLWWLCSSLTFQLLLIRPKRSWAQDEDNPNKSAGGTDPSSALKIYFLLILARLCGSGKRCFMFWSLALFKFWQWSVRSAGVISLNEVFQLSCIDLSAASELCHAFFSAKKVRWSDLRH